MGIAISGLERYQMAARQIIDAPHLMVSRKEQSLRRVYHNLGGLTPFGAAPGTTRAMKESP